MNTYRNPLIEQSPIDTLMNIEQVVTFLEDYHLINSQPDAPDQANTHNGLFWILRTVNQAIEFEIERMDSDNCIERTH